MTTNLPVAQGARAPVAAAAAVAAARRRRWWRGSLILLAVVAIFIGTYFLAWWDAQRLTTRYMADADASFEAGDYLEALTGFEVFDETANEYVRHGGYGDVERIWRHPRARPVPAMAAQASARITEIIDERLTIEQAEQFIQENIGRTNPYLGAVYLRLGELYEADGDLRSAEDIYGEIEELFPRETALIERANANLARLQAEE